MAQNENDKKRESKPRISTTIKKRAFLEALKKSLGVITPAMKVAGIASYQTIRTWREKDPKFASAFDEAKFVADDFVEHKLFEQIMAGDTTAIIFYCKTKMKHRGFSERIEITGKDGKNMFGGKSDKEIEKTIEDLKRKLG